MRLVLGVIVGQAVAACGDLRERRLALQEEEHLGRKSDAPRRSPEHLLGDRFDLRSQLLLAHVDVEPQTARRESRFRRRRRASDPVR